MTLNELKSTYKKIKPAIIKRLQDFEHTWDRGDEAVLSELVFCLLTPQSSAKGCWSCVERIIAKQLLVTGKEKEILAELTHARFKYKKAKFVIEARDKFLKGKRVHIKEFLSQFKTEKEARHWLYENIKGYGLKEASHFLRNVGKGTTIAILDRHILRNMKAVGVIRSIPESITEKTYLNMEEKLIAFSKRTKIPMDHMDLLFWYNANGELFK